MADITLDIATNSIALDVTQPTVSLEVGLPSPTNIVRTTDTDVSGNSWVLDEDDFASDSATKVPTQQSAKAYADTKASASHNHAASDITSGTLTHERGGLEADVSAYSGLVKISGGTTSQAVADTDYQSVLAEGAFADGDKTKLDGIEASADVTDAVNVGSSIHGATAKTTPVDADTLPLIDSAASNVLKKVTWANIKATIKSYYDSVTSTLTNKTINLASNTLSGTLSEFNTACSNGDFAFLGQMNTFSVTQDFQQTGAPAFIQMRRMDTAAGLRSECILDFDGTNGSGNAVDALARMEVRQTVVTDTAESGAYLFASKQAGSSGTRAVIAAGVYHESASGGDLGNNTINFGAVYDDNSLLSCYPFDQYLDGKVDLKKWDGLVPDKIIPAEYVVERRDTGKKGSDGKPILEKVNVEVKPAGTEKTRHEFARKFLSRIGTEYDPLTLDGYAKHWKDKRHLPAMPNETKYDPVDGKLPTGSWVQRLVETAEVQAVLIERLNQITKDQEKRIAALEATVARRTA